MGSSAEVLGRWDRGLKQDASQFFPMHLPSGQSALGSPLALCCAPLLADLPVIPTALGFWELHFKTLFPCSSLRKLPFRNPETPTHRQHSAE